jgi:hypothetical protein
MKVNLTIGIPDWLDRICASPVTLYRKHKYGYSYRRIYLDEGKWTTLDEEDYYRFGNLKWSIGGGRNNFYVIRAARNEDGQIKIVRLHREIMNAPNGLLVDHRNGDSLDNRRANLRLATRGQNSCNRRKTKTKTSSRFIGVSFFKRNGLWAASISYCGKKFGLVILKPKSRPLRHTMRQRRSITASSHG